MSIWNKYIYSNHIIADRDIPNRCIDFARKHGCELNHHGLRNQLLLHLFTMWDNLLISSDHILECLDIFDNESMDDIICL